jgi:hypothetical protein
MSLEAAITELNVALREATSALSSFAAAINEAGYRKEAYAGQTAEALSSDGKPSSSPAPEIRGRGRPRKDDTKPDIKDVLAQVPVEEKPVTEMAGLSDGFDDGEVSSLGVTHTPETAREVFKSLRDVYVSKYGAPEGMPKVKAVLDKTGRANIAEFTGEDAGSAVKTAVEAATAAGLLDALQTLLAEKGYAL